MCGCRSGSSTRKTSSRTSTRHSPQPRGIKLSTSGYAAEAPRTSADGRIRALDSLRGVAILMVLCSHFAPLVGIPPSPVVLGIGRGGVILFFLLSGYLIFRNVQRQPLPVFTMRRLFKILPSFWLNLLCLFVLGWASSSAEHYSSFVYLTNFLLISDLLHAPSISALYWTLLIEVKFYLFIALQYAVLRDRHLPIVIGGLLGLSLLVFVLRGHSDMLLAFFPVFYIGIYINLAERAGWTTSSVVRLTAVTLAISLGLLITTPDQPLWSAIYAAAGTALLVLCLWQGFGYRWLGFLGATSYSNYLYHGLIVTLVFAFFQAIAPMTNRMLQVATAFLAALTAAAALYWIVEQPFVRFGRRQERLMLRWARFAPAIASRDPAAL